jgi:hypothetical protein
MPSEASWWVAGSDSSQIGSLTTTLGARPRALCVLDHALGGLGRGLAETGTSLADAADLGHVVLEVGELAAGPGVERRVGGHAGENPPALRLLDLVQVRCVNKELHDDPPSTCHVDRKYAAYSMLCRVLVNEAYLPPTCRLQSVNAVRYAG